MEQVHNKQQTQQQLSRTEVTAGSSAAIKDNRPQAAMQRKRVESMQAKPMQLREAVTSGLSMNIPKTGLPLHHENAGSSSSVIQAVSAGSGDVAQLISWSDLIAITPGLLVMTEGGLSIAAAVLLGATNPYLMISSSIVGASKIARGLLMVLNAFSLGQDPEGVKKRKPIVKAVADTLRLIESGASTVSAFGGYYSTPEDKRQLAAIVTNALSALIKVVRSVMHFLEGTINSYVYSIMLQGIESAEGVIIAVGGWLNPNGTGHALGLATGASKITRGLVAGGLAYGNRPKQGESLPLINDDHLESQVGSNVGALGTEIK